MLSSKARRCSERLDAYPFGPALQPLQELPSPRGRVAQPTPCLGRLEFCLPPSFKEKGALGAICIAPAFRPVCWKVQGAHLGLPGVTVFLRLNIVVSSLQQSFSNFQPCVVWQHRGRRMV
jgi:hypothetical protein